MISAVFLALLARFGVLMVTPFRSAETFPYLLGSLPSAAQKMDQRDHSQDRDCVHSHSTREPSRLLGQQCATVHLREYAIHLHERTARELRDPYLSDQERMKSLWPALLDVG